MVFKEAKSAPVQAKEFTPLKEEAFYAQKVGARDIFKGKKEAVQQKDNKKEAQAAEANEKLKNLSLVGISWSANPDAIIEDKTAQRTYFVNRGQSVGGGINVSAIFKDKVMLEIDGQEFELK